MSNVCEHFIQCYVIVNYCLMLMLITVIFFNFCDIFPDKASFLNICICFVYSAFFTAIK